MGGQSLICLSASQTQLAIISVINFIFRSAISMSETIAGPYLLRILCKKRFPENSTVCDQLQQLPEHENEVREYAGFYFILYRLFMNVPVMFSGLYFGTWNDRRGQKIPMVFPCIGNILFAIVFIVSLNVGSLAVYAVLLGTLIQSVLGSSPVFAIAVNSYIAAISDNTQRTKNISIGFAMSAFGQSFGAFVAGILEWKLFLSFGIVLGIQCLTVLIIILFLRENDHENKEECVEPEIKTKVFSCLKLCNGIKSYISLLMEKGSTSVRPLVIALLCLIFIDGCETNGVEDVFLMYVTAWPFNWSKSWYSYYISMRKISMGLVFLIVLPFLSNVLKLPDCTMIFIGLLCNVIRYVGTGLSNKSWMIYALLSVWSVALIIRPCIWSSLSKAANEQEQGKMFTICIITDTVARCVGSIVYVYLYGATVAFCPSIVFYVMAFVNIVLLVSAIAKNICFGKLGTLESPKIIPKSCISKESEMNENVQSEVNQCSKYAANTVPRYISETFSSEERDISMKVVTDGKHCKGNEANIISTEKSNLNGTCNSNKPQYEATKTSLKTSDT